MANKLLSNIYTTDVEAEEWDAILKLRALVPKLSRSEATALAVVLIHSHSVTIGRRVGVTAIQGFGQDLSNAVLQVPTLSSTSKLAIAIELLQAQSKNQDEDDDDDDDDDDDED